MCPAGPIYLARCLVVKNPVPDGTTKENLAYESQDAFSYTAIQEPSAGHLGGYLFVGTDLAVLTIAGRCNRSSQFMSSEHRNPLATRGLQTYALYKRLSST
jgi:hypothetical protein